MKMLDLNHCKDCIHYSEIDRCGGEYTIKEKTSDALICRKKIFRLELGDQVWVYRASDDENNRYVLGIAGTNPLICFGVNPSTAAPGKPDPTIRSLMRIAEHNGYDGWIMLNIYPQRETDPNKIHENIQTELIDENLYYINEIIQIYKPKELWAAWGNLIAKRDFLKECFVEISELAKQNQCRWITFGMTNKSGHPRHPLYLKTSVEKRSFEKY